MFNHFLLPILRLFCISLLILLINSATCKQVIQLRKACSHPYLFPGIEPEPYEEGEHLVQVATYSCINLVKSNNLEVIAK